MPSACFRAICKQMAKLHEAIIDILPQEQIKVGASRWQNGFQLLLNLIEFDSLVCKCTQPFCSLTVSMKPVISKLSKLMFTLVPNSHNLTSTIAVCKEFNVCHLLFKTTCSKRSIQPDIEQDLQKESFLLPQVMQWPHHE